MSEPSNLNRQAICCQRVLVKSLVIREEDQKARQKGRRAKRRQSNKQIGTAARQGATQRRQTAQTHRFISIHAHAKGATDWQEPVPRSSEVSIHAPANGEASRSSSRARIDKCFGPRAREGGECGFCLSIVLSFQVSIHAPVEGAKRAYAAEVQASVDVSRRTHLILAICYLNRINSSAY